MQNESGATFARYQGHVGQAWKMTLELYETSVVSTAPRRKMHKQWEEEPWRIEHADDAKITFTTALHGKHTWEMPLEDSRRYHSSSHRWATDHRNDWEGDIAT